MKLATGIVLATLNNGKLLEFQSLFAQSGIELLSLQHSVRNASRLSTVESTSINATYIQNVKSKCRAVYLASKLPTLADDSGIEVDALGGAPGVISAHFAVRRAGESQDSANRRQVLELLASKNNIHDRKARMRCILMCLLDGLTLVAEGVCEGHIALEQKGNKGFGYDPIFIPDGANGKSFAEINEQEKNNISHRALAVKNMIAKLKQYQLVRS